MLRKMNDFEVKSVSGGYFTLYDKIMAPGQDCHWVIYNHDGAVVEVLCNDKFKANMTKTDNVNCGYHEKFEVRCLDNKGYEGCKVGFGCV